MANDLKCPKCGTDIDVENVMAADIETKYQQQYQQKLQTTLSDMALEKNKLQQAMQQFEEKKKNENAIFSEKLQQEKNKLEVELQQQLQKSIAADFENKLRLLEINNKDNEEKLKDARKKELEFLQKENELKNREAELEIAIQKKIQTERQIITEQIRKQETEKSQLKDTDMQLKLKELQMQLDDQKKLAEQMKQKAEQGSMQRQGESQELLLEAILKENFPFDIIEEVGKGVEGADCIQTVRNNQGKHCGKIIYESKRTKTWSNSWLDKLKTDMRSKGADVAILVTQAYPKDMEKFGEKDGVWICSFSDVSSIAQLLRNGIIKISEAIASQDNKGDKMQLLYNYLTGNEFKGQMEAIVEGFVSLRQGIIKEKIQMEKIWKEREKQLEKVLLSTSGMFGAVKGIAGASIGYIPLLEGENDGLIEDKENG